MKISSYNVFFPFEDKYILFNSLRGSILVIDNEVKTLLEKGDISSLDEELLKAFISNGLIIEDQLDEQDVYKLMYEQSKYNTASAMLHVITTYQCNLACIYCYEGKGELEHKSMDEKTVHCAIEFIKNSVQKNCSQSLGIQLFGGEPLMNMPINVMVAKELHQWCEEESIFFYVNAITNGTLLTEKNVEDLAQYSCGFLVTIDGPREIHDRRRLYKNKKGTFDDIIEGLHRVNEANLGIMIRINVDETNKDYILPLFEFLKDNGLRDVIISIKPVFNASPACLSYSYCMPDVKGFKIVNDLYTAARKMHFETEDPGKPAPQGACNAQQVTYFTIDPYLRLFKCAILPPYKKNSVGVVSEDFKPVFNNTNIDFLSRDPLAVEGCRTCPVVPLCRGGCPVEVYETQGTTHGSICRKEGFYENLKGNLTDFVKNEMSEHR